MAAHYFLLTLSSSVVHYLYPQQQVGRLFRRLSRVKNAAASVGRLSQRVTHETFSPLLQLMLLHWRWVQLRSGSELGRVGVECPKRLATKPSLSLQLKQPSFVVFSFFDFSLKTGRMKH